MQITTDYELIDKEKWIENIQALRTDTILKDKSKIIQSLSDKIITAVKSRAPKEHFGILFSGGVDSTLIAFLCKKLQLDFTCYTVGLANSTDLENALITANRLSLPIKAKLISLEEAEKIIKKTVRILGKEYTNVVNIGVGAVVVACIEMAKEDNISTFFSGLGSEELFAGYHRHEESDDINAECWNGLVQMWERDLVRDSLISKEYKIKIETPFLDRELIRYAMQIPSELKIKDNIKKFILREAAISLGLDREFSFRPKKAAQYGSNFDKAILKLAKKNKLKYKKEYLDMLIKSR
ncbi:MAG: asparagine synthase C-terminal domain-containing protein [Nanoarchaeota archaeon]|nr:asparagine synthase C-terminal domain-containing protein [Nanoarchaeota archaeon]